MFPVPLCFRRFRRHRVSEQDPYVMSCMWLGSSLYRDVFLVTLCSSSCWRAKLWHFWSQWNSFALILEVRTSPEFFHNTLYQEYAGWGKCFVLLFRKCIWKKNMPRYKLKVSQSCWMMKSAEGAHAPIQSFLLAQESMKIFPRQRWTFPHTQISCWAWASVPCRYLQLLVCFQS